MTEDIRVKELYSLQLARYAYLQENDSSCSVENSSQIIDRRDFFLFDYFDRLICKKGASLNCNTCFGFTELNKENPPYVTSQFITLADLHEDNNDSPFFCNSNALPFLALIIINIYPAQEQSIERKENNGDQKIGVINRSRLIVITIFLSIIKKTLFFKGIILHEANIIL